MAATEKVFISHSSKNKRFVRTDILPQVKLAKRHHWFDEEDIKGGDNYREVLLKNVLGCQRLLIVVSKEALESEWVKEELTVATKHILEKSVRVDARMVHRRILPVKIDERDQYGAMIESNTDVDLFSLHPYLTLVNYIAVPHNEELNEWLDKHSASDFEESLQTIELEEQRESIRNYKTARDKALQNVVTALRHPNTLRDGFGRVGRLLLLFGKPAVQRVTLAVGLAALFLMIQLVVGEVNSDRFKPEIKIDIQPFGTEVTSGGDTASLTAESSSGFALATRGFQSNSTRHVSLQSELSQSSAQLVDPPSIRVIELSKSEAEAIAAETNVWHIRATAPDGHQTHSYLQLDANIPPSSPPDIAITKDGEEVDAGSSIAMEAGKTMELAFHVTTKNATTSVAPTVITLEPPPEPEIEITITKNGEAVTSDALEVEPGKATDLSIVANVSSSPQPKIRSLRLQRQPDEIEFVIDGEPVTLGTLDEPRPIPPSSKSMQVRLKNDPEWSYATLPGAPEIEVAIDGEPVTLGTLDEPRPIPPSSKSMQVRLKNDPEWSYATLPGAPEIEVAIDGEPVTLGTLEEPRPIPPSSKSMQVRLKNDPEWSYATLPVAPEIEVAIDGEPVTLGTLDEPRPIPPSSKSMQVRLKNDPEWTYATLPRAPEIEVAIDDEPVELGTAESPHQVPSTAQMMRVRLKSDPEWTYAMLPPAPEPEIRHVPDDAYYTALYEVYGRGRMVAELKKQIETERIISERQRVINEQQQILLERTREAVKQLTVEKATVIRELANVSASVKVQKYFPVGEPWVDIDGEERIDVSDAEQFVRVIVTVNNISRVYWIGSFYCRHNDSRGPRNPRGDGGGGGFGGGGGGGAGLF